MLAQRAGIYSSALDLIATEGFFLRMLQGSVLGYLDHMFDWNVIYQVNGWQTGYVILPGVHLMRIQTKFVSCSPLIDFIFNQADLSDDQAADKQQASLRLRDLPVKDHQSMVIFCRY